MNITLYKLIKKIFKLSYISRIILYLRIKKIIFFGMEKEFHNMGHNEIFDKIYLDKIITVRVILLLHKKFLLG